MALVPQIGPDPQSFQAFLEMGRGIRRNKEQDAAREEMRQAGIVSQILQGGDRTGALIEQFAGAEADPEFKQELMDLGSIYQTNPQDAYGVAEAALRGSQYGSQMLAQQQAMQRSASSRGFAPTPVQVQTGTDAQGNPIYETQLRGVSYNPATGQYAVQDIDIGGDILGFEERQARARAEGAETGKAIGGARTANIVADTKSTIAKAQKQAEVEGKDLGEEELNLRKLKAGFPALERVTNELKGLASVATHTAAGRAWDTLVRETGFKPGKGATAAAKYSAIVKNQVLPLLKQTLGAAFTDNERLALEATLGDPSLSPEEKNVQLDAFIESKRREIETKERLLGQREIAPTPTQEAERTDEDILRQYGL